MNYYVEMLLEIESDFLEYLLNLDLKKETI